MTITTDRLTLDGGGRAVIDGGGQVAVTVDGARGITLVGFTVRNGTIGLLVWNWPHDCGHMWEEISPHPSHGF